MRVSIVLVITCLAMVLEWPDRCRAADPRANAMIKKGVGYLKGKVRNAGVGYGSIAAYALLSAGEPATSDEFTPLIAQITSKVTDGFYRPVTWRMYEASIDMMVLEKIDAKLYKPEMTAIINYVISVQKSHGSWFYEDQRDTGGDTSFTQYALLALWAAKRAEIDVPLRVWDSTAAWLVRTQLSDGSYAYQPGAPQKEVRYTMAVAAAGSLRLIREVLYGVDSHTAPAGAEKETKKFGVLERISLDGDDGKSKKKGTSGNKNYSPKVSRKSLDNAIQKTESWMDDRFGVKQETGWTMYLLYSLERAGALSGSKTIGGYDWYEEGLAYLEKTQQTDGHWNSRAKEIAATSFAILFLTRSTAKILEKRGFGDLGKGIMASGRGLPADLLSLQVGGGKLKALKNKSTGPLEDMLRQLANPKTTSINAQAAQEAIVKKVQLGNRDELIGQKDYLLKLIAHPDVDVRRTAIWALGRTGDLKTARLLLKTLNDPSIDVAIEANNALCFLSRKPLGFGPSKPPLPEDGVDASDAKKSKLIRSWRAKALKNWSQWYVRIRPYDERAGVDGLLLKSTPAK